jgi:hypothetical protein
MAKSMACRVESRSERSACHRIGEVAFPCYTTWSYSPKSKSGRIAAGFFRTLYILALRMLAAIVKDPPGNGLARQQSRARKQADIRLDNHFPFRAIYSLEREACPTA